MQLRSIPREFQLAVAYKSISGITAKQWIEAVSHKLTDYESFKEAFKSMWWSPYQQSLVKCNLYQATYTSGSNLSLSAHFLGYAKTAAYLEPKLSDIEIIEAIRHHFPITVQRAMISSQLTSVEQAVHLLKRVEITEGNGQWRGLNPVPQNQPKQERFHENKNYVRNVQYDRSYQGHQRGYRNNDNNNYHRRQSYQ
jgi:hypothetical protein